MICILKLGATDPLTVSSHVEDNISGWIIAGDMHDARRQAEMAGEYYLAQQCYTTEFPRPGKHVWETFGPLGQQKYLVLVS